MATTQRKSGGSRTATGKSRSSSGGGRRTAPAQSRSSSGRRASPPPRQPFRREAGAVVCLLLAIFALFGYFHKEALFITWFCSLLKGLLGYGFWLSTPALLLGADRKSTRLNSSHS